MHKEALEEIRSIVLLSTKAKPMEADKTKLGPFFLERLRGAALVKLTERDLRVITQKIE